MNEREKEAQKIIDEFIKKYGLDMLLSNVISNLKQHYDEEWMKRVLKNLENTLFIYRCRYVEIDGVSARIVED